MTAQPIDFAQVLNGLQERHYKLALIVGEATPKASSLLHSWGSCAGSIVCDVGGAVSPMISEISPKLRPHKVGECLEELARTATSGDLLFLDHLEVLFDASLKLDPLDLLKKLSLKRRVIAVWPGNLTGSRLTYAQIGHPEYRDSPCEGVLVHSSSPAQDH